MRKQIEGQINMFDYLESLKEECLPVDIRGICDDAYCPKCDCGIDEYKWMDCKRCPHCGQLISWDTWHRSNDRENEEIFGKDWRKHFGKALHEGDNR